MAWDPTLFQNGGTAIMRVWRDGEDISTHLVVQTTLTEAAILGFPATGHTPWTFRREDGSLVHPDPRQKAELLPLGHRWNASLIPPG